jgi:Flp pilus assembly protein protease CpaA
MVPHAAETRGSGAPSGFLEAAFRKEAGGICAGIRIPRASAVRERTQRCEERAMTPVGAISFVVGTAAVVEDLARRRISNWTWGVALASGLVLRISQAGWRGAASAGLGAVVGFTVFLIAYLLNGMGAGDVKLMAGFGSLLGPSAILCAAWIAAVVGALIAVGYAVGIWLRRRHQAGSGKPILRADTIPYAPAIVAGAWLAEVALG